MVSRTDCALSGSRDLADCPIDDCGDGAIRLEFVSLNAEPRAESHPSPIEATLDGTLWAVSDCGGLFVGETRAADQKQYLALVRRERVQCLANVTEISMAVLFGSDGNIRVSMTCEKADLGTTTAALSKEFIAEDGEKPGAEIVPG